MGLPNTESTSKPDLNDSGCIQDTSISENLNRRAPEMLDLSDDVLLYILEHCSPRDLKALGFTCSRLGRLVCDRTLWTHVDARSSPVGQQRLRWFLTHGLCKGTVAFKLSGYVNRRNKCLGIQDLNRGNEPDPDFVRAACMGIGPPGVDVEHLLLRMWYPHLPRYAVSPRWPDEEEVKSFAAAAAINEAAAKAGESSKSGEGSSSGPKEPEIKPCASGAASIANSDPTCPGPHFTFTAELFKELRLTCKHLTTLSIEFCNIDYKTTSIRQFPVHLKRLSLRGSRCFNLPLNTSYLGKIQDRLQELEYLNVSECDWFEPASLMPLSKLPTLIELHMRGCRRLSECVAYASLATRYGFRKLRKIDARGSPLADSEVSAFGWLPCLEELYLSPPDDSINVPEHSHKWRDKRPKFDELDGWELDEPGYYIEKIQVPSDDDDDDETEQDRAERLMGGGTQWWAHERRIIVIQPNANHELEQRFPGREERARLANLYADLERQLPNLDPPVFGGAADPIPPRDIEPLPIVNQEVIRIPDVHRPAVHVRRIPLFEDPLRVVGMPMGPGQQQVIFHAGPVPEEPAPEEPGREEQEPQEGPRPPGARCGPGPPRPPMGEPFQEDVLVHLETLRSRSLTLRRGQNPQPVEPGPSKASQVQPGPSEQKSAQAGSAQPDCAQQDLAQPVSAQQDLAQPGPSQPGLEEPGPSKRPHATEAKDLPKKPRLGDEHDDDSDDDQDMPPADRLSKKKPADKSKPGDDPPNDQDPNNDGNDPGDDDDDDLDGAMGPVAAPEEPICPRLRNRGLDDVEMRPIPMNIGNNNRPMYPRIRGYGVVRRNVPPNREPQNQNNIHASLNLVSDSALLRFGRAENDNINYVHIGRNGVHAGADPGARPERSNLRILSVTGYRNVTDRSLEHLATAAPHLLTVNFRDTNVTHRGVEIFRAMRPNCEISYSDFPVKED